MARIVRSDDCPALICVKVGVHAEARRIGFNIAKLLPDSSVGAAMAIHQAIFD
jgi:hypothetical protein